MSEPDFRAMPDVERDAWIAEKVMGWEAYNSHSSYWWWRGSDVGAGGGERSILSWCPSTDWNDALLAAEKVREREEVAAFFLNHFEQYEAAFTFKNTCFMSTVEHESGPTALSIAICEAHWTMEKGERR